MCKDLGVYGAGLPEVLEVCRDVQRDLDWVICGIMVEMELLVLFFTVS